MQRLPGKVAVITGAARGQGRSHAIRLAEEGADIIAVDICRQIPTVTYPMATPDDLAETVKLVEEVGRRILAYETDVRDPVELARVVSEGATELGGLDVVCANAGICPTGPEVVIQGFVDTLAVNYVGVLNTVAAALPHLSAGGSIIITGSIGGRMRETVDSGPAIAAYRYSKRTLETYSRELAVQLAPQMIRVNVIHPTAVDTEMIHNEVMYRRYRPDLESPTREDCEPVMYRTKAMPVAQVAPLDISHSVLFLASDESRYITGQQLFVDGGGLLLVEPPGSKD